ncbi:unnamed protein product [Pleuronectes platessa]|uniref:Uncharacterized protein n=1 Tax=Pleuronectes platessa TaxID=8262 RepID=A0A9N7UJ25_PLEPL|nr:unnamed protein product [Pleuronectes platessa]
MQSPLTVTQLQPAAIHPGRRSFPVELCSCILRQSLFTNTVSLCIGVGFADQSMGSSAGHKAPSDKRERKQRGIGITSFSESRAILARRRTLTAKLYPLSPLKDTVGLDSARFNQGRTEEITDC